MKHLLKLGMNRNGLKVLRVSFPDGPRGFSIQTNGNLPRTHRMRQQDINESFGWFALAIRELRDYVDQFGTPRQQRLLGMGK